MSLAVALKKSKQSSAKASRPVWAGPCAEGPQGGVTQGLLARYFVCPERFRIHAIEGLRPAETFNHRLEYGNMWHVCEESLAAGQNPSNKADQWEPLKEHVRQLCRKFPLQQSEIVKWHNVCKVQFPLCVEWWSRHPDVKDRRPLLQEQVFDVPYRLSSGRVVRLRGKWDSVDLIGSGKNAGIWLQENKSKGDIDELQLKRQLSSGFDLQTLFYLIALTKSFTFQKGPGTLAKLPGNYPIVGVRYNVIRRPLSGGRGSISQRDATQGSKCNLKSCCMSPSQFFEKCRGTGRVGAKPAETDSEFASRLSDVIKSATGPEWEMPAGEHYFFMRWNVGILPADIERFKRECLDPTLENLCNDFEWWEFCNRVCKGKHSPFDMDIRINQFPYHVKRHFVLPFGVYNPIAEGGSSDLDEHLRTGSTVGLHVMDDLFPELK